MKIYFIIGCVFVIFGSIWNLRLSIVYGKNNDRQLNNKCMKYLLFMTFFEWFLWPVYIGLAIFVLIKYFHLTNEEKEGYAKKVLNSFTNKKT